MKVLGLFSGIGGFELGFQRAGYRIDGMCENEPFCQAILERAFPDTVVYPDVRQLDARGLRPDVVTGGFPCQDISLAGKGKGLAGEKSGLWREYRRIVEECRPRWAVIENVSALRSRGLGVILRELAALGYDASWHCIPAASVGAPHERDRVWVVAHHHDGCSEQWPHRIREHLADALGDDAHGRDSARSAADGGAGPDPHHHHQDAQERRVYRPARGSEWWQAEPGVPGVVHGVRKGLDRHRWMHRLHALGNSIVPVQAQFIAEAILVACGNAYARGR